MESQGTNIMPIIGAVFAIAIIVFVGIIIAGNIETESNAGDTRTYTVNDVTINRVCPIGEDITNDAVTVQYNDGTGWVTLTETTDYTTAITSVTVLASAMD